ncbi:RidA family protein [Sodalis sp. RH21]|uniref:RidA family protein n=1 Tax=unclassified Sodalis (in: enterobacteria) TaxID=2636512 RepID=UPI0039B63343
MRIINSPAVTAPAGHYSHAVISGQQVYVSGQLPFALDTHELAPDIAGQALQALKNLEAILLAGGSSVTQLVSVQIYIADIGLWPQVDDVYSRYLQHHRPARVVVPCSELHYGALVEISAVAEIN